MLTGLFFVLVPSSEVTNKVNSSSLLGIPARFIKCQISPDTRGFHQVPPFFCFASSEMHFIEVAGLLILREERYCTNGAKQSLTVHTAYSLYYFFLLLFSLFFSPQCCCVGN